MVTYVLRIKPDAIRKHQGSNKFGGVLIAKTVPGPSTHSGAKLMEKLLRAELVEALSGESIDMVIRTVEDLPELEFKCEEF